MRYLFVSELLLYFAEHEVLHGSHDLFPVVDQLPGLAQRYKLCAFSNTNAVHAEAFYAQYPQALESFSSVFLSHEIGARKPDPDAFLQVCKKMSTHPRDVLFIDDSAANVEGARDAGIDAHHLVKERDIAALLQSLSH